MKAWQTFLLSVTWLAGVLVIWLMHVVGSSRPHVDLKHLPHDGPVVVSGRASGAASSPAPSGATGAAWLFVVREATAQWVGEVDPHLVRLSYCSARDAQGFFVTDGEIRMAISERFLPLDDFPGVISAPHIDGTSTTTHVIPPAVATRCRDGVVFPPTAEYAEVVIPEGARIEISGCRVQDRMEPCQDGDDEIGTIVGDGHSLLARRRHDVAPTLERFASLTGAIAAVAGLIAWRARDRRTRGLG